VLYLRVSKRKLETCLTYSETSFTSYLFVTCRLIEQRVKLVFIFIKAISISLDATVLCEFWPPHKFSSVVSSP
jgi:hypothetical protein